MSYPGPGEANAVLLPRDAHEVLFNGTVVCDAPTTGGRYSAYRLELRPESPGATPHFHRTFTESFYVVAGRPELFDGRAWVEAGEGDHLYIPEGGVHGFRNPGAAPAVLLMLTVPGAPREIYVRELGQVVRGERTVPPEERDAFLAGHDQYSA